MKDSESLVCIKNKYNNEKDCTMIDKKQEQIISENKQTNNKGSLSLKRHRSRRLASTRGIKWRSSDLDILQTNIYNGGKQISGWIRLFAGAHSEYSCAETNNVSSLVELDYNTTVSDLVSLLCLPAELTVYVQIGGGESKRLDDNSTPLGEQDEFLREIGYEDSSRRERLGIDPDLCHLIRFHLGPSLPSKCLEGYKKCGFVYVLKGLVFPQWMLRPLAVFGSCLFVYPGNSEGTPELVVLSAGAITNNETRSGKLVLEIAPRAVTSCTHEENGRTSRHVYLGFDRTWDRDLWYRWLTEATNADNCTQTASKCSRVDLSGSTLERLPDGVLATLTATSSAISAHLTNGVQSPASAVERLEEIDLSRNRFTNDRSALDPLVRFRDTLRSVRLSANQLASVPASITSLRVLRTLDLSDNRIATVPPEIAQLKSLEELKLDRNELTEISDAVGSLPKLRGLHVAENKIASIDEFLKMRATILSDYPDGGNDSEKINKSPLAKVNLRCNQLKGCIILGNYGNLTHLDVSENKIETLDLSALDKLEVLHCSKNQLTELSLNGKVLSTIIAGNNELKKINISPAPSSLQHIDLSHNSLGYLPAWLSSCTSLRSLFASHNLLASLPEHMFCSEQSSLRTLQLGYNKLTSLPPLPRQLSVQELFLQNNSLGSLPDNFFTSFSNIKVLNLSNNRLCHLPAVNLRCNTIEKVFITANCLVDEAMASLRKFPNLKVLHAAYNCFNNLPDICIASWSHLEELVLSGNSLQHLPENIILLKNLTVLRIHSNILQTCPPISKLTSLRVLDLAHNQLDHINLSNLIPPHLQFLDLSCNSKLHVDSEQFQLYRNQRPMSLIDVSGQNRTSLPSVPRPFHEGGDSILESPWKVGFSETAGSKSRLYISQLRLPSFCNTEGLFGVFDGENNNTIPSVLEKSIPRILLEERTMKETACEYMKYTMLSAHRELREKGQKHGVCATVVHISRTRTSPETFIPSSRRYVLRVASVGQAKVILYRRTGPVCLTPTSPKRQLGYSSQFPLVVPDPEVAEINLDEDDEFIIIASKHVWEVISTESAAEEVRAQSNSILAAKRLQDLAQSYGAEDNLSVIVVRFQLAGSGVDQLMRELRHTIRKNKQACDLNSSMIDVCQCGCCCDSRRSCVHCSQINSKRSSSGDRSSPSGQSDQASELTISAKSFQNMRIANAKPAIVKSNYDSQRNIVPSERRSCRGVAKAVRTKLIEDKDKLSSRETQEESDTGLSEEQYKCWEYMLEQNTQLLFDKELNTLSRGFKRNPRNRLSNISLSRSSPHLADTGCAASITPFLSKHFGSARSFNPLVSKSQTRIGSYLNGGPHAAYFGSLQRLMPYNLEYDFAVMQERGANMDSMDFDSRMQQYWGVATTEL